MLDGKGRIAKAAAMVRNFGSADRADAFIHLAIAEFDIPHVFSEEVLAQTENATVPALGKRVDLRPLPLVTIDGADAKDFDDAVFAEPIEQGWRIIVAIVDVSAYVEAGSALDLEARKEGIQLTCRYCCSDVARNIVERYVLACPA